MCKVFLLVLSFVLIGISSLPSVALGKDAEPNCELWVTFYGLDSHSKKKAFGVVAEYIDNNENLSVISASDVGLGKFYNYCIDVVDNDFRAEFKKVHTLFFEKNIKAGFVSIETKDGLKASISSN